MKVFVFELFSTYEWVMNEILFGWDLVFNYNTNFNLQLSEARSLSFSSSIRVARVLFLLLNTYILEYAYGYLYCLLSIKCS